MESHHWDSDRINVPVLHGLEAIEHSKILFCKAWGNYTIFCLCGTGETILVTWTLKKCEEQLAGKGFCRIHKSYLINLHHYHKYFKGRDGDVLLDNGKHLTVSRTYKTNFLEMLGNIKGNTSHP